MCKKTFLLIVCVLLLGSTGHAEDIQWTDLGADHLWSNPDNWDLGRIPTLADDVRIDVPAAASPNGPVIQDGIAAQANGIFTEAAGVPTLTMTGGTLEVGSWIWWGDGADSFAVWEMSSGTVTVVNEFELGWGGGAGTLIMTGGTISAGEAVIPTGSGAFGDLYLYGGTYNVTKPGGLSVKENGLIDITEGMLVLEGDDTAKVNDLIATGLITSYGGDGQLELDYDRRNPGKTTLTASSPQPVNPGTGGLAAYYAFENDANDSSGNGLDGTLVGDPAFVEGQVGMALELDGDDYVDCGNPPELVITDAISIACWVNPAQLGGEQGFAGLDAGYSFKAHGEGVRFTTPGILDHSSANLTLEAGVWQHVAATFQPGQDEGLVFYLNGIETERMSSSAINVGSGPFRIGNNQWNEFLTGLIDEVTIYNRILSEPEIRYLAGHRATPVDPGSSGLLAWWACDEGAGAIVADVSGNGRDGAFVNGDPAWVEGVHGNAIELVGPTLVEVPPLNMELTEATMAGWIKPNGPQPDWSAFIMTRTPGLATGFNILGYQLAYHWNDTSSSWSFRGGDMIAEDDWTFAAVTIEPDRATFYVNGDAGSVNEITHELCLWNSNVYLGGDGNDNWIARRMNGALDDVVLYDRALSAGEIRYLAGFRAPVDPGTDGLAAHYAFENDANDSSGNEIHGTLIGDAKFAEGPAGYGMALDLDGDGDYVDCGYAPQLDITEQITFTYWMKAVALDKSWNTILSRGDDSWRSSRAGTNNFMEAAVGGTSGNYLYGVTPVDDDKWHHIAAVYDGATFSLFVDGKLDASEESTGLITVSSYPLYIGNNSQNTDREWTGLIDEVMIYNRALSGPEVRYLAGER